MMAEMFPEPEEPTELYEIGCQTTLFGDREPVDLGVLGGCKTLDNLASMINALLAEPMVSFGMIPFTYQGQYTVWYTGREDNV